MNIKFWCAVGTVKQQAFREDGSRYEIDVDVPVGEQHIVLNEVLICKQGRQSLKDKLKAKKQKTVSQRILNVPVCKKCQEGFKSSSIYQNWINPPVLKREPTKVKINPELIKVNNETGRESENTEGLVFSQSRQEPKDPHGDREKNPEVSLFDSEHRVDNSHERREIA